jgi:large subunit ribosomal protein L31
MRADIHPKYTQIKVTCSCGNHFETGSTVNKDLHIDVCSECHPFYTGKQKLVDVAGRVDRFQQRYGTRVASANQAKVDHKDKQ